MPNCAAAPISTSFRVGYQRRKVCHRADAEEDERRIPSQLHALIEDVQHGVVFIQTYFQSGISLERDVAENDAQTYRYEQERLKVFLYGKPDEEYADNNHYQVSDFGVGKAGVCEEIEEVVSKEI